MKWGTDAIVGELNREWQLLGEQPPPAHWPGSATLADVLAAVPDDPDLKLAELLAWHADGDGLAGRVVLQAMLGKLILMASQDARHGVGEYVTECWLRIGSYPLDRRPRRIAANLAMDTRRGVLRASGATSEPTAGMPDDLAATDELDVRRLVRAATGLGLIDRASGACLYCVYGLGLRSHEAAERLAISPALVRWRNARSIRRLAPHAALLAAVA